MRLAVVALIQCLVVHTEIGREIDDVAGQAGDLLDAFLRLAVRQRQKQHIARLKLAGGCEADRLGSGRTGQRAGLSTLTRRTQVGVEAMDEFAGVAFGSDLGNLDLGMAEQEAEQFAAAITGATDDGNAYGIGHRVASEIAAGRAMPAGYSPSPPLRPTANTYSTTRAGMSTPVVWMELRNSIV